MSTYLYVKSIIPNKLLNML